MRKSLKRWRTWLDKSLLPTWEGINFYLVWVKRWDLCIRSYKQITVMAFLFSFNKSCSFPFVFAGKVVGSQEGPLCTEEWPGCGMILTLFDKKVIPYYWLYLFRLFNNMVKFGDILWSFYYLILLFKAHACTR